MLTQRLLQLFSPHYSLARGIYNISQACAWLCPCCCEIYPSDVRTSSTGLMLCEMAVTLFLDMRHSHVAWSVRIALFSPLNAGTDVHPEACRRTGRTKGCPT